MRAARFLVFSILLAVSGTAAAVEGSAYWGIAYLHGNLDFTGGLNYHPEGAVVKLGYDLIGKRIAFEVHAGTTRDDRRNVGGADTRLSVAYASAAFLRFNIVSSDNLRFYIMGGYGKSKVHYEVTGLGTVNDSSSGPAYGGGVELYGNETTAIDIDYIRYLYKGKLQGNKYILNALTLGVVHHF